MYDENNIFTRFKKNVLIKNIKIVTTDITGTYY